MQLFYTGTTSAAEIGGSKEGLKTDQPVNHLQFSSAPTVQEICRARVFEEPLVPMGDPPSEAENRAMAVALNSYAERKGPDDFGGLTDFLRTYPNSSWSPALLTHLGTEYYNTAHYRLALDAWAQAWAHQKDARDAAGYATMNTAVSELAYLYARLGRMTELEALLKSVEGRVFFGGTKVRLDGSREALWTMQNRPEVAFRCGPLALHRIKLATDPQHPCTEIIHQSASTQKGFSLPQVAELSRKVGLNYQMAFRGKDGDFVVPSVVHWKAGHYAAIVRKAGDRYLVEDPTFGNTVWPTRQALEAETSGYFLIPPGELPTGWRAVEAPEGERIWGKGMTSGNDGDVATCRDLQTTQCGAEGCSGTGMAVSSVHLMTVNLQIRDNPVGYNPPVGPPVHFLVRFNSRDVVNGFGVVADLSPLGLNWTHDWAEWIMDSPQSPMADVKDYVGGGGARTFTGFDTNTQSFAYQQYDQTLLTRTGTNRYEMLFLDGSKKVFANPDGSAGSTRRVFLTQIIDKAGNALSFTYDTNYWNNAPVIRLVAVTDAIGQVTTLSYEHPSDPNKITKVTDPFGRSALLGYDSVVIGYLLIGSPPVSQAVYGYSLASITDVLGLTSQVTYLGDLAGSVNSLITPYGTNTFIWGGVNTTRFAETTFPDGSRERVEYNQTINIPTEPAAQVPVGMATYDGFLTFRNTFYWNRNACASGYGDYTKAQLFHWLHTSDGSTTSGILEGTKQPLENRVWYDYQGQGASYYVGPSNRPNHVGRVLDDGTTQLYTYAYDGFGRPTNTVDPVGRTFSYIYATNGIDLLAVRQTSRNDLLLQATYNSQHRPLTITDASGQTTTNTYNARGQLLSTTNPKAETTTFAYDTNGYLLVVDGPLPGTNDSAAFTYDAFGRPRTLTSDSHTLTFDYDAMDRITRITFPDGTYTEGTYDRLSLAAIRDRAGRTTSFQHNNMQQLVGKTDPLGRTTHFDWCSCGALKSLTDPMGRATTWLTDIQGRRIAKQYADGSQIYYSYENTTSRVRQVTDENLQVTQFTYNRDNTFSSIVYGNSAIPTPSVSFSYDGDYERLTAITDGTGTTLYQYVPVAAPPVLGAGKLASVDGPLLNDTITFDYDELGRMVRRVINGVAEGVNYDPAGRVVSQTNALDAFAYGYDGVSSRLLSRSSPNGPTAALNYGGSTQDFALQQIIYSQGGNPVSQFGYGYDLPRGQIRTWSQQTGTPSPNVYTFGYDAVNQLTSATVTNGGTQINAFAYTYDLAGNRLSEMVSANNYTATYNALNQISTTTAPGNSRTNEWDAARRLTAVTSGNQRTELTYDGQNRLAGIRELLNGVEVSHRLFVWKGGQIAEERDINGIVNKRFFAQGVQLATGTNAGSYYYTRDHLGSIRELTDSSGNVRARYAYDPFGRRTKISGDLDADFGFAGMFWAAQASLWVTHFRAYDPNLGRWLSRDPIKNGEMSQGPNLYAYVRNEPVGNRDPMGLCTGSSICACFSNPGATEACAEAGIITVGGGEAGYLAKERLLEAGKAVGEEVVAAAECAAPKVAQAFDVVETRLASLEVSFQEQAATLIEDYGDRLDAIKYLNPQILAAGVPLWTDTMIQLDREFFDLAQIIAERFDITFDEAWALLANHVGFNPELW